jgi:hypothetical protein
MKIKYSSLFSAMVLSTTTVLGTLAFSPLAQAGSANFFCGRSQGVPATIAKTSRGNVPVIRWVSNQFTSSGYSPQKRCQIVSQKFQQYKNDGTLKYLTTGQHNGIPVVCVASYKGGSCSGVLFTLKPGQNPGKTLRQLFSVRDRASGPLNETEERVYIDMEQYLQDSPIQEAYPSDEPSPVQPEPPTGKDSLF